MPNNGKFWNWSITNTLLIIVCSAVAAIFGWLALTVQDNTDDISDLKSTTAVNSTVIDIAMQNSASTNARLLSIDGRLMRLEAHFGTLPKEDKMGDVLIRWKIRSAAMTDFGAVPRVPGDQDTMDRTKAMDLAKCGIVEILGKPSDVIESAAEVLDET